MCSSHIHATVHILFATHHKTFSVVAFGSTTLGPTIICKLIAVVPTAVYRANSKKACEKAAHRIRSDLVIFLTIHKKLAHEVRAVRFIFWQSWLV